MKNDEFAEQTALMQACYQQQYHQIMEIFSWNENEVSILLANLFVDNVILDWELPIEPLSHLFKAMVVSMPSYSEQLSAKRTLIYYFEQESLSALTAI